MGDFGMEVCWGALANKSDQIGRSAHSVLNPLETSIALVIIVQNHCKSLANWGCVYL